jgi:TonB-dependent starch-binding outer membrane protein SusC
MTEKQIVMQKKLIVLFLFIFVYVCSDAQRTIKGTVTDGLNQDLLIGVNVLIPNTNLGTVTDIDGKFELLIPPNTTTIIFSYIGYKSQEVNIPSGEVLDVVLNPDMNTLDEVVIVDYGYGAVKREDMTGSVSSLGGREISKIPIANAAQAMTGRLAGVNVMTTDGSPDAEVVIRVRGGGSITQDNSPLFVVDGFIVNSIRDIPPSDIESINVLKDASSTAIYGAQAANGVVVITTKKPKAGKVSVSYNGFYQIKELPNDRRLDVLSPYEFALANYEHAKLSSNAALNNFTKFYGVYDDLELYKNVRPTDWQQELFGNRLPSQYHNISLSGGTEMTRLSLSLTNNNDVGLLINNGFNRNVLNFKLDQTITPKLSFSASTRITNTVVDGAGTSGRAQLSIKDAIQTRPTNGLADNLELDLTSVDNDDDFATFIKGLINPLELVKQDWRKRTTNDYILNGSLSYDLLDDLNIKTTFTSSKQFDNNLRFYGPLTGESFNNGGNLPLGEKTDILRTSYRWLNTINYKLNTTSNSKLDLLVGHEVFSNGGTNNFIRSEDFRLSITPEELFANMTFGRVDRFATEEFTDANRVSLFGRADYQLMNKYMATFTVRGDASSKFSRENRIGIFPAAALAWKINEESFLKGNDFVNELKLRASYGETGNDRIDATATQFLFVGSTLRGPGFGNFDNPYYAPSGNTLYNPNLVWETTINRNVGVDFGLINSRLTGTLDLYSNTTRDLLLRSAIPSNTGFSTQWDNIGSTSNQGIELALTGTILEGKDYFLSMNFNIGRNVAKIVELDASDFRFFQSNWASTDLRDRDDFFITVGGKLGDIYGYVTDGYYSPSDFAGYNPTTDTYTLNDGVPNSGGTVGNTRIRPGFLKLKDLNGDGLINSQDRQVIGNALPKAQGGFGLSGTYKGFDVSAFFNWSYGNDVYNTGKIQFSQYRRVNFGNLLESMSIDNRFTYLDVDGSITGIPGEIVTDLQQLAQLNEGKNIWSHTSHGIAQAVIHSWAIEDGSFLRLNNLNIGYTLPRKTLAKAGVKQLRLYLTGNNLKLWTNYTGYDPEVSTGTGGFSGLTPGVDFSAFPRSRSYTIGANINF